MTNPSHPPQQPLLTSSENPTPPRPEGWTTFVVMIAGIAICAAAFLFGHSHARAQSAERPRVYEGKPGPWGQLEYTRITIDPPEAFLEPANDEKFAEGCWVFKDMTRGQVGELFTSAELSDSQRDYLFHQARWQEGPGAVVVFPNRDLILGLSVASRQKIYHVLSRFEENAMQAQPFIFRPELLGERFEKSGLSEATIAGFKKLLYPHGKVMLFADASPYMSTLGDVRERTRFFQIISRRLTLLVKLKITPDSDIKALDSYWDVAGDSKELLPLFESLTRVPGGCRVDVAHLLPLFARKRIYTFPPPSNDPLSAKRNCHWSAFNFFNDPPDDRFCDPQFIGQSAQTQYVRINPGEWRLGDVIVLIDSAGDSVHSAVYIADDIVFTKNGGANSQPWVYMHIQDMLDSYPSPQNPEQSLPMIVLRRKDHPAAPKA